MDVLSGFTRTVFTGLAATLVVSVAAVSARACDTPVYRYAMYRWFPAPYEVYHFYEDKMDKAGEQMKAAIDEAGESMEARTNIMFLPVDLVKDKELNGVPPDVKDAWQKQEDPAIPSYLVSSPFGSHLAMGPLTVEDLPSMIDSPVRQQAGKLLEAGRAGVYILLKGKDDEANTAAEEVVRSVVDDVASGKIMLYSLPSAFSGFGGDENADTESQEADRPKLSIGHLSVSRDDPKEKWLVNCLLGMEGDLRESADPIMFMVYGRGRVLFSCLGKGIHRDNLIQDVEFITGACSCTVKEQNPGIDLLMRYNWDAAAEALSRQFGAEEGSRYEFGGDMLFPELMIPSDDESSDQAEPDPDTVAASDDVLAAVDTSMTPSLDADGSTTEGPTPGGETDAAPAADEDESVAAEEPDAAAELAALTSPATAAPGQDNLGPAPPATSFGGVVWVGIGLLGVLIVLFGATFIVLRPR